MPGRFERTRGSSTIRPGAAPCVVSTCSAPSRIKAFTEQPLDHAVEIARIEQQAAGVLRDGLDEAVAVPLLVGQRKEQLEVDRLERQKVAGNYTCGRRQAP